MSSPEFSVSRETDRFEGVEAGQLRRVRSGDQLLGDTAVLRRGELFLVIGPLPMQTTGWWLVLSHKGIDRIGFRNLRNGSEQVLP